jgi:hypothetical protein
MRSAPVQGRRAWDLVGSGLSASERRLVRATILDLLGCYWDGWYRNRSAPTLGAYPPPISMGVARRSGHGHGDRPWRPDPGSTLRSRIPRDLLPHGLADDGAQEEGVLQASTMFYRFLFLDPPTNRGIDRR